MSLQNLSIVIFNTCGLQATAKELEVAYMDFMLTTKNDPAKSKSKKTNIRAKAGIIMPSLAFAN